MNDKFLGWVLGTVIMAACCIGVPLLIVFLIGTGVFAWFADNGLAANLTNPEAVEWPSRPLLAWRCAAPCLCC